MSQSTKDFGDKGEDIAAEFLSAKGFSIIERNFRYGHGEIDIVAKEGETLVFVEVKTRTNLEFGDPIISITKGKQKQIKKIAEAYLFDKEIKDTDCRIDVIGILLLKGEKPDINHIENAF